MLEPIKPKEFKYVETEILQTARGKISLHFLNEQYNKFLQQNPTIKPNEVFICVKSYEGEVLKLIWGRDELNSNYENELRLYKINLNKFKMFKESEAKSKKDSQVMQLNKQKQILIDRIDRINIHLGNKTVQEIGEKKLKHLLIQKEDAQDELLDIETKLINIGD